VPLDERTATLTGSLRTRRHLNTIVERVRRGCGGGTLSLPHMGKRHEEELRERD